MVILHIAAIENDPFSGVCVAVPAHVSAQASFATVGLLNIQNNVIPLISDTNYSNPVLLPYAEPFQLDALPEPFCHPDLVVFHECYRLPYLRIARTLRRKGIPYILLPHGELRDEAQRKKYFKKQVANALLFRSFIEGAEAIQCLSDAEVVTTHFGRRRFIGTNGIAIPEQAKTAFHRDGIRFVYIGRYEWRVKGLDLLLDAIRLQRTLLEEKHAHFDFYGPDYAGQLSEVNRLVHERSLEAIVTVHTEITGTEKADTLLASDIFVQTSRHEGMPLGILEAMSYGVPCLLTEGTALGAFVCENQAGWVADNDATSIAAALAEACERQSWNTYSQNARAAVRTVYAWPKVAGDAVAQYRCLLKERNGQ